MPSTLNVTSVPQNTTGPSATITGVGLAFSVTVIFSDVAEQPFASVPVTV